MAALLLPFLAIIVLSSITPVPAIACFQAAWNSDRNSKPVSFAIVFPTAVFPAILLAMHGLESEPEWIMYGKNYRSYMAVGWSAWVFMPPFAAGNFLIARSLVNPDYTGKTPLTLLGLTTCLLISGYFCVGNLDRAFYWIFPGSSTCAYGYGLYLFVRLRGLPKMLVRYWLLTIAWLISATLTVLAAISSTKQMVAQLPEEAPDCFVVTAATRGHSHLVQSQISSETGLPTSKQLATFRAFEEWLQLRAPRLHESTRRSYNKVGPVIAQRIESSAWRADMTYIALKPLEWLFRLTRFAD